LRGQFGQTKLRLREGPAILGFTKSLAQEVVKKGVTVKLGFARLRADRHGDGDPRGRGARKIVAEIPAGRLRPAGGGSPTAVAFLALGGAPAYITGTNPRP